MSVARYIALIAGKLAEVVPATSSAGAATAGQVVALNASGLVDNTMLPSPAFSILTDGSTVTWAINSATLANATLTLNHATASRTINLTGLVSGGTYLLVFKQDSTGGATATLGTGATWYQGGAAGAGYTPSTTLALTTTANAINILAFTYDGTNAYANLE
jgi:phage protein D